MDKISLRKAEQGDEKILAYIQTESWKAAFSEIISSEELKRSTDIQKAEEMYSNVLRHRSVDLLIEFVCEKPHCIAGWSKNRCDMGANTAELICIHSLCDKWGRGYGSAMMRHVLDEMKKAGYSEVILWVFEENIRARRFYEKHGFELSDRKNQIHGAVEVMYLRRL